METAKRAEELVRLVGLRIQERATREQIVDLQSNLQQDCPHLNVIETPMTEVWIAKRLCLDCSWSQEKSAFPANIMSRKQKKQYGVECGFVSFWVGKAKGMQARMVTPEQMRQTEKDLGLRFG